MMTGIMCLLMGAAMAAEQPSNNSTPADPKKQFEESKTYWEAMKAAEEAKKAAYDAKAAAVNAAVPGQTAITGKVEEGTDPAKPEALVLTVSAADAAAEAIAERMGDQLRTSTRLLVVTSIDDLSLANLDFYELQRKQLDRQLVAAAERIDKAKPTSEGGRVVQTFGLVPPVAAIGGAIEMASKLGSYFLTDYKFGKVDLTLPERTISYTVAAHLQPRLAGGGQIFIPQQLAATKVDELIKELESAFDHYQVLVVAADSARASDEPAVKLAVASGDAVARAWEAFVASLTTVPAGGKPVIESILRQKAIKKHLDQNSPVLVLDHQMAGSYYTKKSLWTFLGGPPLYAAGAVAVSYALLDGKDRHVIASGTVPVHGGYGSINSITRRFRPRPRPASSNPPAAQGRP